MFDVERKPHHQVVELEKLAKQIQMISVGIRKPLNEKDIEVMTKYRDDTKRLDNYYLSKKDQNKQYDYQPLVTVLEN